MLKAEKKIYAKNKKEWRKWLKENHQRAQSVWLVYYKVKSGIPSVRYDEAVNEALCFGWIDSKAQTIDENSYKQLFTVRKSRSVWSKVNKRKIAKLIKQGLMTPAGLESIAIAKKNGSWNALDNVEKLTLPDALQTAFKNYPAASDYFQSLSRTNKRNILQWIALAKRPETIERRIKEVIENALQKTVPQPFRRPAR
jgi:uncharacterized protein YdeI (YjbR/CyaY-like superfamily)